MIRPNRALLRQTFFPFSLNVLAVATPLASAGLQASLESLYTTILITNAAAAANSVWLGDASISVLGRNGLEILPGRSRTLTIGNERQLYELQAPLTDGMKCQPDGIPFIVWDVSTVYLIAAAPTVVGGMLFPEMYL